MVFWSFKQEDSPFILRSDRLVLRPAKLSDWADWNRVRSLNEKVLRPFEPRWSEECLTESFFRRRVSFLDRERQADRLYGFLIFKEETLIGGININNVQRGASQWASLGYWLDLREQKQGYMRESVARILCYAFQDLMLHRINAACLSHNRPSRRVLIANGFEEEGYAKEYLQINGVRQDHMLFGLNSSSFEGGQADPGAMERRRGSTPNEP